jgi:hypothetical protein
MASPRCRYGHDHGTPSVTLIPDLRNRALEGNPWLPVQNPHEELRLESVEVA